jgi:diacylglycerol kinase family enzyme
MKIVALLNQPAGTSKNADRAAQLHTLFAAAGIDAEVRPIDPAKLADEIKRLVRSSAEKLDAIAVGGGDGTLSSAAGALAGTAMPLGVLPLGTLNHFAKDLGIPLDPQAAVDVIAGGRIAQVDTATVNDRTFINNSSLGVYPTAVVQRDAHQARFGAGKWRAMAIAAARVFRRFPMVEVELTVDGQTIVRKTPVVMVGNNAYELKLPQFGERTTLCRGALSLYVANTHTRWGMVKLVVRALLGRLQASRDFESFCLEQCDVTTRRGRMHVAVDGEVEWFPPKLHYQIRPRTLHVLVPDTWQEA